MSAQHTWPEVAHYYLKSGIDGMASFAGDEKSLKVPIGINDVTMSSRRTFTPLLRALEDMTKEEMLQFATEVGGGIPPIGENLVFSIKDGSITIAADHGDGMFWFYSLDSMTSAQFHWLIQRGFDVFGLIESGQAIRKEAGK